LVVTNTGNTVFAGINTYTGSTTLGSTTINAGTLTVLAGSNLSNASLIVRSGTVNLQNASQTITATTALTMGDGPLGSTSTIQLNGNVLNLGGNVTYTASANSGTATI